MKAVLKIITASVAIAAVSLLAGCDNASCIRAQKDWESEMSGLNREVIVYSATGTEIWRFTGKFDVDYTDERILFDDENRKRHTIYFKNGTVIINEI